MADLIGWIASAILLATLIRQIVKQAGSGRETQAGNGKEQGVSNWLFIGQATASILFVIYSVLLHNWIFIVTNSCLLVTALVGQWITVRRR